MKYYTGHRWIADSMQVSSSQQAQLALGLYKSLVAELLVQRLRSCCAVLCCAAGTAVAALGLGAEVQVQRHNPPHDRHVRVSNASNNRLIVNNESQGAAERAYDAFADREAQQRSDSLDGATGEANAAARSATRHISAFWNDYSTRFCIC